LPRFNARSAATPLFFAALLQSAKQMLPWFTEASLAAACCLFINPPQARPQGMADRSEEIRYLRQKARQFRELAAAYETGISPLLLEIAVELELRAEALERRA
jgi:hypothetical protein